MTHFLYKPHVTGPENKITSPDVLIERASLFCGNDEAAFPVHRVVSTAALQWPKDDVLLTPAVSLIACGGGVLLSFGLLVAEDGESIARSDFIIARSAWRLRNVANHTDALQLRVTAGDDESLLPVKIPNAPAEGELALARATMLICTDAEATINARVPASAHVRMLDSTLNRQLTQTTQLVSAKSDTWDERPLPRYTVGPVGEVEHYI